MWSWGQDRGQMQELVRRDISAGLGWTEEGNVRVPGAPGGGVCSFIHSFMH